MRKGGKRPPFPFRGGLTSRLSGPLPGFFLVFLTFRFPRPKKLLGRNFHGKKILTI